MGRVDDAIAIAETDGVTLATFGDMLRVPGGRGSLLEAKARGADVRMVYSPLDALELARREPERHVAFLAIGFETTAPATAVTLLRARAESVPNFSIFCNHVLIEPPLRAILDTPGLRVDAFIGPGHVSSVIGTDAYRFIPEEFGRPIVVSAFEPVDVLHSIAMILRQRVEGRCEVENQYTRVVRAEGNPRALAAMAETMEQREDFEWRGLGVLPRSGLRIREEFAAFDAERLFALPGARIEDPKACRCGEVLTGQIKPWECGVFGTACTPERPLGTCMVSSEGACAAFFSYGRLRRPPETAAVGA
jgi:hydrogenase expression/formation protein HypD